MFQKYQPFWCIVAGCRREAGRLATDGTIAYDSGYLFAGIIPCKLFPVNTQEPHLFHETKMNDLNGLDWSSKPATGQSQKPNTTGNYSSSAFSTLKPTPPVSGRTSPLVNSKSPQPPAKTSTPANDSFANLVAFSGTKSNKNLSLQEQQKQLAELKAQQLAAQKKRAQDQWAGGDDVWNTLGSGRSTPAVQNRNGTPAPAPIEDEEDVFAAFNKPVVTSKPPAQTAPKTAPSQSLQLEDDDDPFGLSEFQSKSKTSVQPSGSLLADGDEDDFLGDLGKPPRERSPPRQQPPPREPGPEPLRSDHPQDKAVADLVDMGFPADKARRALEMTDTGLNVQAAVGWLLNQAHEEARQKTRSRDPARSIDQQEEAPGRRPRPRVAEPEAPPRDRSSTPSGPDFGSTLIKSAGVFWKQAQKQVQQVVSEFNSDSESGSAQPKWMREAAEPKQRMRPTRDEEPSQSRVRPPVPKQQIDVTDEALMLEAERPTPPPRQAPRSRVSRPEHVFDSSADTSRDHSPAMPSRLRESHSPQPAFMKQQDPLAGMMRPKQPPPNTRQMLNKQAIEDQASQAYVSSARRRKPATSIPQAPEGDLLEGASSSPSSQRPPHPPQPASLRSAQAAPPRPTQSAPPQSKPRPAAPVVTRPAAPKRTIPSISPIALKASHQSRLAGNESFKRGDFAAAHEHYTASLKHIPASHPLQLVLLTNRALTALKTGQPKVAITDADAVITLVGPSKGEGETVDLQDSETQPKPMRDYYGKSLMRKAEALENMEKWSDAAVVWRQCVEDGHGGATAIQSRARAERAAAPKPPPTKKVAPPRAATRSAPPVSVKPAAAVNALRASNAAAEKLDDEKFALADSVSARINAWKNGKEGNLRALLTSLDTVLWEGAGWKKVSMADVVLTNKVKIIYMKGIGKCHPDKVSKLMILANLEADIPV